MTSISNTAWSRQIINALVAHGYTEFALCPGSRSTALTAAVAQHPECTSTMHFDERGQAFYALGHARVTGRPLPLVCTSGSAVANFFPAIVEASNDRVPMLVLTTDRPPELQDCGSNQTINQQRIFGGFSRYLELPCATSHVPPGYIQSTISLALRWAQEGPVQINIPFRKPFDPDGSVPPDQIVTQFIAGQSQLSSEQIDELLPLLTDGLLVVGQLRTEAERDAVQMLSEKLRWPLFADVLSGVTGSYYDLLLRHRAYKSRVQPKTVLHLGGQFVSAALLQFLKQQPPANYIHVAPGNHRLDPNHQVTHRVQSEITGFCQALTPRVQSVEPTENWDARVDLALEEYLAKEWGEIAAARFLTQSLAEDEPFYVASSLSIRHVDAYGARRRRRIAANRGTSGIDGTIATACGFAAATGKRTTLLLGDLAFLHDVNSLALVRDLPLRLILLNNDGGAIFSQLPIRKETSLFERYFQTPHGLNARHAAELFGLHYAPVRTAEEFDQALGRATLIEVASSVAAFERQKQEIDHLVAQQLTQEPLGVTP